MKFVYDDGGRKAARYKGKTGDCVCRSIAIATGLPYQQVYDNLNELGKAERASKRRRGKSSSRKGIHRVTYEKYLKQFNWIWTPTMFIGSGCKVHLVDGELPMGRLIVAVSRHLTAVIDGVIYDTHDPQRFTIFCENGVQRFAGRCVYGYYAGRLVWPLDRT